MGQLRTRKSALTVVAKKNITGSTIAAKLGVIPSTTSDCIKLPAATTDALLGVTLEAIENNEWGSVQTGPGLAVVTAGGALATVGVKVMVGTNGKAVAFSAGAGTNANVLGCTNTAAAGDGVDLEVELAGPFTVHQG